MANFLPNLSLLSIGMPSSKRPREDEEEKTDFRKKLIDIDFGDWLTARKPWCMWVAKGERSMLFEFKVDYSLEEDGLFSYVIVDGGDKACVKIKVAEEELLVNSLFHDLSPGELETCFTEPNIDNEFKGYGAFVLDVVDVLAFKSRRTVRLANAASPTKKELKLFGNDLTSTLALLRGVSFYEARGYLPTFSVQQLSVDETPRGLRDHGLARKIAAQTVDLMWTHVTTTTPLNRVLDKISAFHEEVVRVIYVPEFVVQMYSQAFCSQHATIAYGTVNELLSLFNGERDSNAVKYEDKSIRELAKDRVTGALKFSGNEESAYVEQKLNGLIGQYMSMVWYRDLPLPEPLTLAIDSMADVSEDDTTIHWPPPSLTKMFFKSYCAADDDPSVTVCKPISIVCHPTSDGAPASVHATAWDSEAKQYSWALMKMTSKKMLTSKEN